MKKNIFGRKFKRDINERKALFRSLISSLILKERIQTTEAKAKAIKGDVDKIITKVKKRGQLAKRLIGDLVLPSAIDKLINDIAPRFTDRSGGYTRIIRMGKRFGDDASMVLMEWSAGPLPVDRARLQAKPDKGGNLMNRSEARTAEKRVQKRTSRPSVASRSGKGTSQK